MRTRSDHASVRCSDPWVTVRSAPFIFLRLAACALGLSTSGLGHAATIGEPELGPYQVIYPVSAVVRHADTQSPATPSLYNGDGLNHSNPILAQHSDDLSTMWQHELGAEGFPVTIEFDLGKEFLVNELWIWQPRGDGMLGQGIADFDILMRDEDGNEVGTIAGANASMKGVGMQPVHRFNAFGECVFLPIPDCVRFLELRILSNLGDVDLVTLAEVTFAGRQKLIPVPEPQAAVMLPGILLGLAGWRRRTHAGASMRKVIGNRCCPR